MKTSLRARGLLAALLLAPGCTPADQRTPTEAAAPGGAVVLPAWDQGRSASVAALSVSPPVIDIVPNVINYTTTNLVQIRVYSSSSFDAVSIDPSTVRFVIDGALPGAPVATFSSGAYMTSVSDLNGDGLPDRVFQFRVAALKAAGLSGPNHQFVVQGQATSGPFQSMDPTPPAVVGYPP